MPQYEPDVLELEPRSYNLWSPWKKRTAAASLCLALAAVGCTVRSNVDPGHQRAEPVPAESVEPTRTKAPSPKKPKPASTKLVDGRYYGAGARGGLVPKIEQILARNGCKAAKKDGVISGAEGKTIRKIQKQLDLKVDGRAGPEFRRIVGSITLKDKDCNFTPQESVMVRANPYPAGCPGDPFPAKPTEPCFVWATTDEILPLPRPPAGCPDKIVNPTPALYRKCFTVDLRGETSH